jgi:Copper transport outer membrane protein, MctB
MINFRYHIVSLMAVFMALAVGIAAGVSLGPSVDQGLQQQAAQDRKQVSELRAELDRRNALDEYREAYEQRVGDEVIEGALAGVPVAVVRMPEAPGEVVQAISIAVATAGGTMVREAEVRPMVFDPAKAEAVEKALQPWSGSLGLSDTMSPSTKVGIALGRAIASRQAEDRDQMALDVADALDGSGLVSINRGSTAQAQLVIVVAAEAPAEPLTNDQLAAHLQFDVALTDRAAVVLAGPNSLEIDGTDVLAVRSDASAADLLSTVDVADLSSGVGTTVLAGQELLLTRAGRHYGAMARAEAPLPDLPVR